MKKCLSFFGIMTMVFITGMITLILFPQPLFSNSYDYKNFDIYSDYEVNQEMFNQALDQAIQNVSKSELNDPEYNYDIFLSNETLHNKFDNLVLGEWSVARSIDNNVIIKRKVNEVDGTVENGNNQFDLVYVLTHEMIHCLQNNKYGIWKFNPMHHPPFWKLEGYPEYIGRRKHLESKDYRLQNEISRFLSLTQGKNDLTEIIQLSENESTPFIYCKGRLMIEYLIDIKKMNYDEILQDSIKEEEIYSEMLNWCQES